MDKKVYSANTPAIKPVSLVCYINADGVLIKNAPAEPIMVRSVADLDLLSMEDCPPAGLAYTAAAKKIWQRKADGTWESWSDE